MKNKMKGILAVVLTLSLMSTLLFVGAIPVSAAPGTNAWGSVNLPALAEGSNIGTADIAPDGAIFAAIYESSKWAVKKSVDECVTWTATKYTGTSTAITAIEVSANYAVDGAFFVGTHGGDLFRVDSTLSLQILTPQDSNATEAGTIYDLDSWYDGSHVWILAGTDIDVLILEYKVPATSWIDLELAGGPGVERDAIRVAFASDFATSSRFWTLADPNNDGDYDLTSTISPGQWGLTIKPWDSGISISHPFAVDMAQAPFYTNSSPAFYVALSDGSDGGNIFLVQANATAASAQALWTPGDRDFGSVEVAGTTIIAGDADEAYVEISDNAGDTWTEALKQPSPGHNADEPAIGVYILGTYNEDTGHVLALTHGTGSAVSLSIDGGYTYNGISKIDGDIDWIVDIAFSPVTSSQPAVMITYDNAKSLYSIWRTNDATATTVSWVRILATHTFYSHIGYTLDGNAILIQNEYDIYKSTNNGDLFNLWRTLPSAIGWVEDWVAPTGTTIYVVGSGGFYGTSSFGPAIFNAVGNLESIAMFGDTIIVGSNNSSIFVSLDKGQTWKAEQSLATLVGDDADVYVAFGPTGVPYFASSDSVVGTFAISSTGTITAGSDKALTDSLGGKAEADCFSGIWVSPDNTLYALGSTDAAPDPSSESVYGYLALDLDSMWWYADGSALVLFDGNGLYLEEEDVYNNTYSIGNFVLVTTSGSFDDGDSLDVTGSTVKAVNENILAGRITVEDEADDTNTGYIDVVIFDSGHGFTIGVTLDADEDDDDWQADRDDQYPRVAIIGGMLTVNTGDFTDEDELDIVSTDDFEVDSSYPTIIAGTFNVQGETVLDTGSLDLTWIADFGFTSGDLGDSVDVDHYNLEIVGAHTPATGDLFRLLIGESDNVWETAPIDDAWGLWGTVGSNYLWTIVDGEEIWALKDTCSGPVTLVSPANASRLTTANSATLTWNAFAGATKYDVVCNTTPLTVTAVGTETTLSKALTGLTDNTAYSWKVRVQAGFPFQSRWSALWTFTTMDYLDAPGLMVPILGSQDYTLYPSFLWSAVTGADSYMFELSKNADFSSPITTTTALTQYTQATALIVDSNYYWRVKATSTVGGVSAWSATGNFHTGVAPTPPVTVTTTPTPTITLTVPQPVTPGYIWAIIAVGAILTLAVIVLIVRTRRVV